MPTRSEIAKAEADRFRRDNPLSSDKKLYDSRRLEAYPETRDGSHPREAHDAYQRYTQLNHQGDRVQRTYVDARNEEEARFRGLSRTQKDYYGTTSDSILPTGHARLEPMARRVGDSELSQARSRREPFQRFPYMYKDLDSKARHSGFIQDHFRDSIVGYGDEDTHVRYASARPPSRDRDLYDNEPTRNYSPFKKPFPPNFPPPEHYSTDRGDDEDSDGGEWSPVKKTIRPSTSARHAAARRPR